MRVVCFWLLLLCISVKGYGQFSSALLNSYVADTRRAYDANSDSLGFYADRAVALAIKQKDIDAEIEAQRLRAVKLFLNGQSEEATRLLLEVARHADNYPLSRKKPLIYYAIAQVYNKNQYLPISESYLRKGIDIAMHNNDDTLMADGYNRLGILYESKQQLDSALICYQIALAANEKSGSQLGKAYSLENIAGIYAAHQDPAAALSFQKQALAIKKAVGTKLDMALCIINIAETMNLLKQWDSAAAYTQQVLAMSRELGYKDLEKYAYQMLSSIAESRGNYPQSLEYHKQYSLLNDTIYTEARAKQLAEVNARYQTEQHEQRIKELSQQATIQQLHLRQRNLLLAGTLVLLGVSAIIFYLAYNRRKLKAEARLQAEINKQQAMTAREVLHAEERERKRIAADLHDGLGQLLSATLINMEGLYTKLHIDRRQDPEAGRIFGLVTQSYDELRSISHQMMPGALLKKGLVAALRELIAGIDGNKLSVNLEVSGLKERLSEDIETVLYRVSQECINNVLKHAHASRLYIQLIQEEGAIAVTIEDNGRGFNKQDTNGEGIGLKNMYSRVQYLGGTLEIDTQPGKGTLVAIYIPTLK